MIITRMYKVILRVCIESPRKKAKTKNANFWVLFISTVLQSFHSFEICILRVGTTIKLNINLKVLKTNIFGLNKVQSIVLIKCLCQSEEEEFNSAELKRK